MVYSKGSTRCPDLTAERIDNGLILRGKRAEPGKIARRDGLRLDERAPDAGTARPRPKEGFGRLEVDAAGRHQPDLRERAAKRLEEARASQFRREDLHDVGTGLPGRENL